MKDLTEYARSVDKAATVAEAQQAMQQLIDQFDYKGKQQLFSRFVEIKHNKTRLQKWAWDLVLIGNGQKVIK